MQTCLMWVCLTGAAVLAPLALVLWFRERGVFPVREMLRRFRSLPPLAQIAVLAFTVNLIVYGSTKGPTNAPPLGLAPAPVPGAAGEGFSPEELSAGYALVRVGTNETWDFSMPTDAVEIAEWRLRGAAEDWRPVALSEGPVIVMSDGCLLDRRNGTEEVRLLSAALGILPEAKWGLLAPTQAESRVWYRPDADGALRVTWRNALFGRDTNTPVSLQAEIRDSGVVICRYDLRQAGAEVTNAVASMRAEGTIATNLSTDVTSLTWYRIRPEDLVSDDRDGDGIRTAYELRALGTDPDLWDSDRDGVGDGEELAAGTDPTVRDSDGDGLVDGSDPDPLTVTDLTDADADGIPDAYEQYWFGDLSTVSGGLGLDATGFSLETKIAAGMDPTAGASSARTEVAGELVSWKLWSGFEATAPGSGVGVVFDRTIAISKAGALQQFFLSSKPDSAGGWDLEGMSLWWEDSSGAAGVLTASAGGDSVRLALSSGNVTWIRFQLIATGGWLKSETPVYLVGYSPTISLSGGNEIEVEDGVVATVSTQGAGAILPVSVDWSRRPCKSGLQPQELDLAELDESAGNGFSFSRGEDGSFSLVAAGPGVYEMPDFGVSASSGGPLRVQARSASSGRRRRLAIVLQPCIDWGVHRCYPPELTWNEEEGYARRPSYPLDSSCLWRGWRSDLSGGWGCDCTPKVVTGVDDCPYVATELEVADGSASGSITVGGQEVWSGEAAHVGDMECSWPSFDIEPDNPCAADCSDGCATGDCDEYEGGEVRSLKFRIPIGRPRKGQIAGFAYLDTETPVSVTPTVFRFLVRADSQTTVTTNGVRRTVTCGDARGRTLLLEPRTNGTRIEVRTTADGTLEHTWELWNENGDAATVRMRQISRLDNVMVDETYAYGELPSGGIGWRRTDNVSGVSEEVESEDRLNDAARSFTETRIRRDADGSELGREVRRSEIFGAGETAVLRETYRSLETASNAVVRQATYWTDPTDAGRHGRLRLLFGNDCAWVYHDWDAFGRERLRVEQRNGSSVPTDFPGIPPEPGMTDAFGCLDDAFVTVYGYDPLPGDDADPVDSARSRCEIRYVVVAGVVTEIGRTWRVYAHEPVGSCPAVRERRIRAGHAGAATDDETNVITETVTLAREAEAAVPLVLRGKAVESLDEDGVRAVTTVAAGDGRFVLTTRRSRENVPEPTYSVEELDAVHGLVLRSAVCLTADDTVIDEVTSVYDDQNRLRSKTYLDGTQETNAYSCCRLLWHRDRKGRKVLRSAVTGEDTLYWADEDVWLAEIQTNGHRVTQHFCDGLARETNTVVYVAQTPGEATAQTASVGRVATVESTVWTGMAGDGRRSTDARGVIRLTETHAFPDREVWRQTTADPAGDSLSETCTRVRNGRTVIREEWGEQWRETVDETFYDADGCRTVCSWTDSSDGVVLTNRVARHDFLGRCVEDSSVTSSEGVSNRCDVAYVRDASNDWWRVMSRSAVAANGAEIGLETERRRLTGIGTLSHPPALGGEAGRLAEEVETELASGRLMRSRRWIGANGTEVEVATDGFGGETTTFRRYGLTLWRRTADGTRHFEYDACGRVVRESMRIGDEIRPVQERTYDVSGDLSGILIHTNATSGTRISYGHDAFGRLTVETNALGEVTTRLYDAKGNLRAFAGEPLSYWADYDTSGRRVALATTRDGVAWDTVARWEYGPTGEVRRKTEADGSQTQRTFSPDGRETRLTRASGSWREQAWDTDGNRVAVTSSDGAQNVVYGYDGFGRQTSVTGGLFGVTSALSDAGVATNECTRIEGRTEVRLRETDGAGRIAGRGSAGREWQTVAYAADGKIAGLSTPSVTIAYLYGADGQETGAVVSVAGGVTVSRRLVRDRFTGRLDEVGTFVGESRVWSCSCRRDARGRLVSRICQDVGGSERTEYAYDANGRLVGETVTSAGGETSVRSWSYDGAGNFTAVVRDGVTTGYSADAANRYAGLAYDADGNLLGFGGLSLAYDSACRLTGVSTGGVSIASSDYDDLGRRIRKTTAGAVHRFFYDGSLLTEERIERTDGTEETVEYFWGRDLSGTLDGLGGIGGLVAVRTGGVVFVPVYDQNGNIVAYLDGRTGACVARYAYDGFGATVSASGASADSFRFRYATKYADLESGLVYYGRRHYAPGLGRWLTRDPLDEDGGLNLYAFCDNDAVNGTDPDGRLNCITALGHYLLRSGETETISFSELDTTSVKPSQFECLQALLGTCRKTARSVNGTKVFDTEISSVDQGLYLGHVTVRLKGEFVLGDGGYWRFGGTLSCEDDIYDFNASTHRKIGREALTTVGRKLRGVNYTIRIVGGKAIWEYGNCCEEEETR